MAEAKTKPTRASVEGYLASQPSPRSDEGATLLRMMKKITGEKAVMWGPSIVGFGTYRYTYSSGQSGDWPLMAFSPRKAALVVYLMPGVANYPAHLKKLGRHKHGGSCLYLPKLADVDLGVLEDLIEVALVDMKKIAAKFAEAAAESGRSRPAGARRKAATKTAGAKQVAKTATGKRPAKKAAKQAAKKRTAK